MEPVTIAIVGAVVFGVVTTLAVFLRELMLSRDKDLNDKAQQRALAQETRQMEKLRTQMENNRRFDSHYQVLGANKEAIQYIDQKIEEILSKKFALIQRYGELAAKESSTIIGGDSSKERKGVCDLLRAEIDQEIQFYNNELQQLQTRRASIWDAHKEVQQYLVTHEQSRNDKLDSLYLSQTGLLEKIYLRHNENAEHVATKTIDSGTEAFKLLTAPWRFLTSFFRYSSGVSADKATDEADSRQDVEDAETDLNGDDPEIEDTPKKAKSRPELVS